MLAIRTNEKCSGIIVGQTGHKDEKDRFVSDGYTVYEIDVLPEDIDYQYITDSSFRFWQRSYDGIKYGEYVSYSEYLTTKSMIDSDSEADSLNELYMNIINDFKDRLKVIEIYLGISEAE